MAGKEDTKKASNGGAAAPSAPSEAPKGPTMADLKATWEKSNAAVEAAEKARGEAEAAIAVKLHTMAKESAGKAPGVTPSVLLNGKRYVANKARETEEITLRKVADRSFAEV